VWLARHPVFVLIPVVALTGWLWAGLAVTAGCTGGLVLAVVAWGRAHPASFDRTAGPMLRAAWRRWWGDYRGKGWRDLMVHCELAREHYSGVMQHPRIIRVMAPTPSIDVLRVSVLRGQDERIWLEKAPTVAHALGAHRVAVAKDRPGRLRLVVERKNPFEHVVPCLPIPASVGDVDPAALDVGDDEHGQPVLVSVVNGRHLLVGGATGSGKSGFIWGLLRQLGPLIREGIVRVWMIDPKGGQETEQAAPMFYRRATDADSGLVLLHEFRKTMKAKQAELSRQGLRKGEMSKDLPLDLLMIDELAAILAYTSGGNAREANKLVGEIMTQARSVLGTVCGYVQEPTKDIVGVRDLFTQRLCLAVTGSGHPDMVLGEDARKRGALADEIPLTPEYAGVGFRVDEGTRLPVRIRGAYVSDADIAELARTCTPGRPPLHAVPDEKAG
jgi:S-DNA-T family DNA segregation ATPase FtsK/SpoIIIE